jgi:hypothetical protein
LLLAAVPSVVVITVPRKQRPAAPKEADMAIDEARLNEREESVDAE